MWKMKQLNGIENGYKLIKLGIELSITKHLRKEITKQKLI